MVDITCDQARGSQVLETETLYGFRIEPPHTGVERHALVFDALGLPFKAAPGLTTLLLPLPYYLAWASAIAKTT
jgi:hypothetical protein